MSARSLAPKRGFQGSETHACNVVLYPHKQDPVYVGTSIPDRFVLDGRGNNDNAPSVISVQTDKSMSSNGTFTVVIKESVRDGALLVSESIVDDDWIDIELIQNGARYHAMRGVIESISFTESTTGSGATTRTLTLTGMDFTAIFSKSMVWVNQFAGEILDATLAKILDVSGTFTPEPDEAVVNLLEGLLKVQTESGRTAWRMPPGIPGRTDNIVDSLRFVTSDFDPKPSRRTAGIHMADPQRAGVWQFVSNYADPMFCELYTDLVPKFSSGELYLKPEQESSIDTTSMGVIFRTRPFPRLVAPPPVQDPSTDTKAWERLPTVELNPQDVMTSTLGRSGAERYNTFYASSELISVDQKTLIPPLWNKSDVYRHGVREMFIQTPYVSSESDDTFMLSELRWIAMNWHCLNPFLFNGSITLARLRPNIRVGMRLRVRGENSKDNWIFYVEQVSHTWNLGSPRTQLGVTRGWRGPEEKLRRVLEARTLEFSSLPGSVSGAEVIDFGIA